MRVVSGALAFGLLGCASGLSGTIPARGDVRGAVLVIRVQPQQPGEAEDPGGAGEAASTVDRGSSLASPLDEIPESELGTAEGRSRLGDLYARAGLMLEAIVEYRESVALDPASAIRQFKLGLAYQSVRRFDDALAAYEEAARLEPASAWAHAAVSIVRAKMGNQEGAFAAYETVRKLDADMAEGLLEVILRYGTFHEV